MMAQSKEIIDIEQEYFRNKNLKREDIEFLRQWVRKHPQYTEKSDLVLFLCLHSSYYDLEKAKNRINQYNNLRQKWPEIFKNRNPSISPLKDSMHVMLHWILKQRTRENYKIFYIKIMNSDTSKFDIYNQLKWFTVMTDFWLSIFGNIEGFVIVMDMNGFSWGHIPRIGINPVRKIVSYVQEAFPVRLKSVHLTNAPALANKLLLMASPFLHRELRSIIHIHVHSETLYEFIPKHCLPKDYSGDDLSITELHETMMSTLIKHADMFA